MFIIIGGNIHNEMPILQIFNVREILITYKQWCDNCTHIANIRKAAAYVNKIVYNINNIV